MIAAPFSHGIPRRNVRVVHRELPDPGQLSPPQGALQELRRCGLHRSAAVGSDGSATELRTQERAAARGASERGRAGPGSARTRQRSAGAQTARSRDRRRRCANARIAHSDTCGGAHARRGSARARRTARALTTRQVRRLGRRDRAPGRVLVGGLGTRPGRWRECIGCQRADGIDRSDRPSDSRRRMTTPIRALARRVNVPSRRLELPSRRVKRPSRRVKAPSRRVKAPRQRPAAAPGSTSPAFARRPRLRRAGR